MQMDLCVLANCAPLLRAFEKLNNKLFSHTLSLQIIWLVKQSFPLKRCPLDRFMPVFLQSYLLRLSVSWGRPDMIILTSFFTFIRSISLFDTYVRGRCRLQNNCNDCLNTAMFKLGAKNLFMLCLLVKNISAVYSADRCNFLKSLGKLHGT